MKATELRVERLDGNVFKISVNEEDIHITKSEAKKLLMALLAFKSAGEL